MTAPPENENTESLAYDYDPRFDWQRETEGILEDLRIEADALLADEQQAQTPSAVNIADIANIDLSVDEINNVKTAQNQINIQQTVSDTPPSVPSLIGRIRRPLLLSSLLIVPLVLLIWSYSNTTQYCETTGIYYKNQLLCTNSPEKRDAMFEYIACDYIQTHQIEPSFVAVFGDFDKMQRDSVVIALERQLQGDKFSFRKNVAISYFNHATKYLNQKQIDSACWAFTNAHYYFNKIDMSRISDTLQKISQIASQGVNICDSPIQFDYSPSAAYMPNDEQPYSNVDEKIPNSKSRPIKRAIKSRIESRIDNPPIPPEIFKKMQYQNTQQSPY